MDLNRRQILCGLGGIACGAACAGLINPKEDAHAASEKMQRFQQAGGDFGWKPHKLDVEAVQKVAYEAYHNKGYACGYGVVYSIVGSLAEQYGAPYNQFPFSMLESVQGRHFRLGHHLRLPRRRGFRLRPLLGPQGA